MRPRLSLSVKRAFAVLVALGFGVEGLAAWLAYRWAAEVLPCRWATARELFGPGTACPMPIALVGHYSSVPVALCGALVASSVALFTRSFLAIALATRTAKRHLALQGFVHGPPPVVASAGLSGRRGRVAVIDEDRPTAFCVGLWRPQVVVSTGLLGHLGEPALRAVLAHELSHLRRREPLRRALAKSVARGLFFVPSLRDLAGAVPVEGELAADAAAAALVGREALARALYELLNYPVPPGAAAIGAKDLLAVRLSALEGGGRPRSQLRIGRLAASALALGVLLGAGAWLPRPVHVIVLSV